jgi:hypothetical protein
VTGESRDVNVPVTDGNDWRISVYLSVPGAAPRRIRPLSPYQVARELRRRVPGPAHTPDGRPRHRFLCTHAQHVTVAAEQAASDLLAEYGMPAHIVIERWHPIAEQREPAEVSLPVDEAAVRPGSAQLDAGTEQQFGRDP